MVKRINKKYQFRFNWALIFSLSGSLAIANYILPINALEVPQSAGYRIAKTPDERQPEAVQQGIEQIPTAEPPVSPQPKPSIDSPLPVQTTPQPTEASPTPQPPVNPNPTPQPTEASPTRQPPANPNPTPQPTEASPTPRQVNPNPTPQPPRNRTTPRPVNPNPTPQPPRNRTTPRPVNPNPTSQPPRNRTTPRPVNPNPTSQPPRNRTTPRPVNPNLTPQPANNSVSPRQDRGRQPINNPGRSNNQTPNNSPISPLGTTSYRKINFVDVAFGILSKGDFKSQGRYFHFYQFEGRENQLIQIRLVGSADQRRSNNLSLNPVMLLLDPNNKVILKRGSSGTTKDAFVFVRLPVKGTYTIAVTSQNSGDTGRYSLALRNDRASYNLDESGELTAQSSTLRQNGSPYNVSQFQGKKDQLVSIRVDSTNEQFSPYIVLLNSQGERIAANNDKDGIYSALIDRARLPKDDTYYIVVTSNNPQERGTYRLTIF
ncbi:PPC domain-containing protein [Halotia branconii]|uniref:Peptidase n=1 Tax=Halotia branconii CENA392 TaxID=1539056 RepID=A0AAJ6NQ50_9CYAN|nr:peptidase [Halotia branconii]WGV24486.1 peptidase [Halotia branconii CENA392]